jgi:hypothetical protein
MAYMALALLCQADHTIAIPTSAILMALTSVVDIGTKLPTGSVQPETFENWLVSRGADAVRCRNDLPPRRCTEQGLARLRELGNLKDAGRPTDAEFQRIKRRILDSHFQAGSGRPAAATCRRGRATDRLQGGMTALSLSARIDLRLQGGR